MAFATVADYIEPERRSAAMAAGIIGGPILAGWFGTASLFWTTGFLGLATDCLLVRYLKDERPQREAPAPMAQVFAHPPLLAYAGGGFLINLFMTMFFFYFPLIVTGQHHLKMTHYYMSRPDPSAATHKGPRGGGQRAGSEKDGGPSFAPWCGVSVDPHSVQALTRRSSSEVCATGCKGGV